LLNTVPGIGRSLALTILYEVDSIERFPTVKDFCNFCRLIKGSVARTGKLNFVQPTGDRAVEFAATNTDVYAVGAFLLAGSETYRMKS
jgi:hypothetical protein